MQRADHPPDAGRISVRGAEDLPDPHLRELVRRGARCVRFEYCVSAVIATFRFQTDVYLTESWQERYLRGLPLCILSVLLGPWGVPWGPILTARTVWVNLSGGVDTTAQVLAGLTDDPRY